MYIFKDQRVRLRAYDPNDLERFTRWWNDPEVGYTQLSIRRYSTEGAARRLERVVNEGYFFCIEALDQGDQPRHIGTCSLREPDWRNASTEFSITIGEKDCWDRGYGTAATRLLLEYAFGELNLHRVQLFVLGFNARAIRSYEKVGFKLEATLDDDVYRDGRFTHSYLMGILRPEWQALYEKVGEGNV